MTLKEALVEDPTIFDFVYTPSILINDVDLKDYIKSYYLYREIGFETIAQFKHYLQRAFVMNVDWFYARLQQFSKMESMDQFVTGKQTGTNIAKFYATPVSGYEPNDIETNKNENTMSVEATSDLPIIIYKVFDDNYPNLLKDFVTHEDFRKLFMRVY